MDIGTTFKLIIPLESEAVEAEPEVLHEPLPNLSKNEHDSPMHFQVLIVDDNRLNAIVAQSMCKQLGYQSTYVNDGFKAIKDLQNHSYDLILMDKHMPGMDGIETCQKIRQELKISTPILGYTADMSKDTRQEYLSVGAQDVVYKPIDKDEFAMKVNHIRTSEEAS
ncbi:response regulator [Vibrio mexicanus]|uniref:response regulator n=1 Tax=Vibrio mexicanus TaxID=1004326 RepID=UPI00069BA9FE|nr:response regulator [Vibrio mexicanus]